MGLTALTEPAALEFTSSCKRHRNAEADSNIVRFCDLINVVADFDSNLNLHTTINRVDKMSSKPTVIYELH